MNHNYPESILKILRQRKGLEEDDTSRDEEFNEMSPHAVFEEVLQWEGIDCYYSWYILCKIRDIYGIYLMDAKVDENKAEFVKGFGNFMRYNTRFRTEIVGMEMGEHEIVTIHYEGGGTRNANIYADSELAALRDILKNEG